MKLNILEIQKLINENFKGNISFFADELDISREYLSAILNNRKSSNSSRVCNAIIEFCIKNNIDYKRFIFFSSNVKKKHKNERRKIWKKQKN